MYSNFQSQTSQDFEVVEESALNFNIPVSFEVLTASNKTSCYSNLKNKQMLFYFIFQEFKSLVEQLGKVVNEKGLIGQNFSCKECGQIIGLSFCNVW